MRTIVARQSRRIYSKVDVFGIDALMTAFILRELIGSLLDISGNDKRHVSCATARSAYDDEQSKRLCPSVVFDISWCPDVKNRQPALKHHYNNSSGVYLNPNSGLVCNGWLTPASACLITVNIMRLILMKRLEDAKVMTLSRAQRHTVLMNHHRADEHTKIISVM